MKKIWNKFFHYIKKDSEIDIKLFKILGIAGILVSVISGVQSIVTGVSLTGGLIDFFAAFLSVLLLWFVDKTGKYVIGYIITDVVVFMGLFTLLFFEMGGLNGSMSYFFAFGLVFSFLMFKGKLLIIMEALKVLLYVGVCYFSYIHPEFVTELNSEKDMFVDHVAGILISGVGIGLIFLAYIAEYKKQKELAEEANKAKSQFLANMSHEIRTPINMMMGMNEMIMRDAESDTVKEYATNAEAAGKQLLFEVNQVLQFTKLDAGKEDLINEPYDFMKMISNINAYFEKEATNKNIDFLMKTQGDIPNVLIGDARKLSQILMNLLSNGVKYTREGNVTFTIRNEGIEDGKAKLYFEITDTGAGIEESKLKDIFLSFERADLAKNRNIEGTGLGLAIAYDTARMFDTEIKVESEYGKGSKFYLTVTQTVGDTSDLPNENPNMGSFLAPEAKILVVDDNKMNLSVVKSLLKKTMVRVLTADSAVESYEIFAKEKPHVVLMDYMMPDIDGIEALKHIREMKDGGEVPIVVLTADVSPGKKEMFLSEGFDGYLTKPVDWRELEHCIMMRLPKKLVTEVKENAIEKYSREQINLFEKLLNEYDIDLSEGMRFVGGDLGQYARIARYFTGNTESGMGELKDYLEEGNLEILTQKFHSLKGNARNVGAVELYYLSKRLEKRCRQHDVDYVRTSGPLAEFEWKRVKDGIDEFLVRFEKIEKTEDKEASEENDFIKEDAIDEVLSYIESNSQAPAVRLLEELIKIETDEGILEKLKLAKSKIGQIEFEEAEEIIKGLKEQ